MRKGYRMPGTRAEEEGPISCRQETMPSEPDKSPAAGASLTSPLVFAAAFCLYALSSSPAIGWLDSPEFVAQAVTLGVAHSPGHPLPALLGRLATLLPFGDMVWRVNLMSSLCAAGAVTLLFACGQRLLAMNAPALSESHRRSLAMIFALATALAWALWSNAVRAEVYALQALLTVGALLAILRYESGKRGKDLLLASFFLALALSNHHLMAITVLVPAAIYVLSSKQRPSLRMASWIAGIGFLGLSALAYLPIRSLTHPIVNFGAPHTLERFFWTLRGAAFSKSANTEHFSSPLVDTVQVVMALADAITLPLFLLALMGAAQLLGHASLRRLGALLLGIVIFSSGFRVLLGFDPETPDHHAYLLPAIFSLVLLALACVATLCTRALEAKRPLPKAPLLAVLALALFLPIQFFANHSRSNHAASWASDDLAHWETSSLPPQSLLLIAYFQSTFRLWALQAVEGARPDLAILDRSFLTYPGMAEESKLRWPELTDLIDAPLRAGAPSPIRKLTAISKQRPVRVQLHLNVGPALASELTPAGAHAHFPASGASDDFESWEQQDLAARQALAKLLRHSSQAEKGEAKRALLWHDAMRLDTYCHQRKTGPAARVYQDAKALAPKDIALYQMAQACGLEGEKPL